MKTPAIQALICLAAFAAFLSGQTDMRRMMQQAGGSVLYSPDGALISARATISPPTSPPPVITGAPFAADGIGENVQLLPDGNRITRPISSSRMYRDSYGRTRRDESPFRISGSRDHADLPIVPEIFDPVSGSQYFLDTARRIAHRFSLPVSQGLMTNRLIESEARPPGAEFLGTRQIEGLKAEGWIRKITIPAGVMGNEKPIENITETWFCPDLQMTILSTTVSSASQETIQAVVNIELAEPDPALFRVPEGYDIVDESDAFTLIFGPANP